MEICVSVFPDDGPETLKLVGAGIKGRCFYHTNVCTKNVKVNFCRVHIMKTLMGGWGITSLIPNLSTRWTSVVNFVPQLLQPRKEL